MRNLAAALVAALLLAMPAFAQTKQPMYQSGRMVHGDLAKSVTQGVVETVGDLNGDALGIGANPYSVSDRKGLGICFRTGAASSPHNVVCLGHDTDENGLLTLDSVNGLADKKFYCRINGVLTECFGGTGGGGGTGTVISVGLSSPGGIFAITGTNPITTTGTFGYTTTGVSGGIPYFSSASVLSASAELTANNPVIGGGTGATPSSGTRSGNTTQFATSTGSKTTNNCVKWDANGNVVDAGIACGGGGGGGGGPTECADDTGTDGQVCNRVGSSGTGWGSRVIGAPGAANSAGAAAIITGGVGNGTGAGGAVTITSGAPGATGQPGGITLTATDGPVAHFVQGGGITLTAGQGGDSGDGGDVGIFAGLGGPTDGANFGGAVDIYAGDAAGTTNARGGPVTIAAGNGAGTGNGGAASLAGGTAGDNSTHGGNVDIFGGNGVGSVAGGYAKVTGGTGGDDNGDGGSAYLIGGAAGSTNSLGGSVYLEAASGTGTEGGGLVQLQAGAGSHHMSEAGNIVMNAGPAQSGSAAAGGDIKITAGQGDGTGNGGNVYLSGGPRGTSAYTGTVAFLTSQADQSYVYNNAGSSAAFTSAVGTAILDGVNSTFTITLPEGPKNGQIFRIATDGAIGTLTITTTDGTTVKHAPASMAAGTGIAFIYRETNTSWYRLY